MMPHRITKIGIVICFSILGLGFFVLRSHQDSHQLSRRVNNFYCLKHSIQFTIIDVKSDTCTKELGGFIRTTIESIQCPVKGCGSPITVTNTSWMYGDSIFE